MSLKPCYASSNHGEQASATPRQKRTTIRYTLRCLIDRMVVGDFHLDKISPQLRCPALELPRPRQKEVLDLSWSRGALCRSMQKRNQSSDCFLLFVICGDMQVHAVVMCARKPCQIFECSLMYPRRYPCVLCWSFERIFTVWGKTAAVQSCTRYRESTRASPACWHPCDRVPRDVDVVYLPSLVRWGSSLAELLRDMW